LVAGFVVGIRGRAKNLPRPDVIPIMRLREGYGV